MINDFICEVCDILEIEPPEISRDTSHFASSTMMAQCELSSRIILIRDNVNTIELLFAISHELRHLWQYDTESEKYLSNYRTVDQCATINEYNLQPAEIDANAFAYIIMVEFFGMKPLFNGISDFVRSKIHKRVNEIISENQRADN